MPPTPDDTYARADTDLPDPTDALDPCAEVPDRSADAAIAPTVGSFDVHSAYTEWDRSLLLARMRT